MKVLVIGAAGRLGSEVVRQLEKSGKATLRLADVVEIRSDHESLLCDVLHPDQLIPAMEGMDVVYAAQTNHPKPASDSPADQLRARSSRFDVLVRGTFNIMQGAALLGIPKVVQVTSEAARGQKIPIRFVEVCDEDTPAKPDGFYGLSKYLKEIVGEYTSRIDGVQTLCLRNGWFQNPGQIRNLNSLGSSLLYQRSVTRYDMARASVLAIENTDSSLGHEVFLLTNSTEFTSEEVPELRTNPEAVFERHYPGILELYREYEIDFDKPKEKGEFWKIDDISKAKRVLGWEPTFTLRTFYENLNAGEYTKGQVIDI